MDLFGRGANYEGELYYQSGKYVICDEGYKDTEENKDDYRYALYRQNDDSVSFNQFCGDHDGFHEGSWTHLGYNSRENQVDKVDHYHRHPEDDTYYDD